MATTVSEALNQAGIAGDVQTLSGATWVQLWAEGSLVETDHGGGWVKAENLDSEVLDQLSGEQEIYARGWNSDEGYGEWQSGLVDFGPANQPPSISAQSFTVVEDGSGGPFQVDASDADGSIASYAITGGNDPDGNGTDAFAIDDSGELTVADAGELTDGEDDPYTLDVEVTDDDGATTSASVTVNIDSAIQTVDLSDGDATGTDGEAEAFVYEFEVQDGRATNVGDGEVNLGGFNPDEDILRFDDTSGTWSTDSEFLADENGVVINENPFEDQTTISFDANDQGQAGVLNLVGVEDGELSDTPFEVV